MRRTCWVARGGLVASAAMLVVLVLPGMSIAAQDPSGHATALDTDGALLARGAGYGDPKTARDVRALQQALRKVGWQPGPVDGLFGPRTEAAVVQAQRAAGLAADGIVGPRTAGALETAVRKPLRQGAGYRQPDGSPRVRKLQARLGGLGLEPGPVDGRFGPRTKAAVERLQRSGGVPADGTVGPGTRRLLAKTGPAERSEPARSQGGAGAAPDRGRDQADRTQSRSDSGGAVRIRRPGQSDASEAADDADQGSGGLDGSLLLTVVALMLAAVVGLLLGWLAVVHAPVSGRQRLDRWRKGRRLAGDRAKPSPSPVRQKEAEGSQPVSRQVDVNGASAKPPEDGVRALGYVSVPDTDSLKGPAPKAQMEAIDALCERQGWRLVEVVRDYEQQRGKALDRPGLGYALERLEGGEASCVIVSELRRLGRSVADLGRTLEGIGRAGGRLVALDMGIDTATVEGRKAANVLVTVSSWERERVAERTRKGLEAARASGGPVSRPSVNDLPALKEWIAELRESGMTLQAIADRLNEEGIPTMRGGAKWRPSSVQTAAGYRRPQRSPGSDAEIRSANGGGGHRLTSSTIGHGRVPRPADASLACSPRWRSWRLPGPLRLMSRGEAGEAVVR